MRQNCLIGANVRERFSTNLSRNARLRKKCFAIYRRELNSTLRERAIEDIFDQKPELKKKFMNIAKGEIDNEVQVRNRG
jgi:hypothetical protein